MPITDNFRMQDDAIKPIRKITLERTTNKLWLDDFIAGVYTCNSDIRECFNNLVRKQGLTGIAIFENVSHAGHVSMREFSMNKTCKLSFPIMRVTEDDKGLIVRHYYGIIKIDNVINASGVTSLSYKIQIIGHWYHTNQP